MQRAQNSSPQRLVKKHPLAIRWFHWVNFPVLMIMIWSGLLIYWANDAYRLGWGKRTLLHFFPQGFYEKLNLEFRLADGMAWHFAFMWIFFLNGLLYVLYTAWSGEWRFLLPGRSTPLPRKSRATKAKIKKAKMPSLKCGECRGAVFCGILALAFDAAFGSNFCAKSNHAQRVNGDVGLTSEFNPQKWKLRVEGLASGEDRLL